jgi:hypothetical protein
MKTRRNNFYKSAKNVTYKVKNGFFNLFGLLKSGVNNTSSSIKSMVSMKRRHKRRHNKSNRRKH